MDLYKTLYLRLFNRVTDALERLERGDAEGARALLVSAQQEAEAIYMEAEAEEAKSFFRFSLDKYVYTVYIVHIQ